MAYSTPQVIDGTLHQTTSNNEALVTVDSPEWYTWLNKTGTTSFRFLHSEGNFTARREWKKSGHYWYAYRKQQNKLYKAYLGKTDELTLTRLNTIALALAQQTTTSTTKTVPLSSSTANRTANKLEQAELQPTQPIEQHVQTAQSHLPIPSIIQTTPSSDKQIDQQPVHPLLMTKLFPSLSRTDLVARPQLLERLNSIYQQRLILITASAGSGKSTILSAWCYQQQKQQQPCCWLSLDSNDNDPARFLSYVVAALHKHYPEIEQTSLPVHSLLPGESVQMETALTLLINTLTTMNGPVIFIFDDYHTITNTAIHKAILFLIDHLPSQVHLVLISRVDPPFPLTRLRAQRLICEFHDHDLRFSYTETQIFLNHIMQLQLSTQEITRIDQQAEGWIAGLQLMAISLQGRNYKKTSLKTINGSQHYIFDYLSDEVLQRQPLDVQQFLLQTAILERLNVSLCNAVTGQSNGDQMLHYLEQANLFLIPLDDQRQWYRYHHLFSDFLLDRIQKSQPEQVKELHRRASHWYKKHGLISATIEHAQASGDLEFMAQELEYFAETMIRRGEIITFLHWLNQLPPAILHAHLQLHLYKGGSLISIGRLEEAEKVLEEAAHTLQMFRTLDPPPEHMQLYEGEYIGIMAILAAYQGNLSTTITRAEQALKLLPVDNTFLRSTINSGLATAYLFSGEFEQAYQTFEQAISLGKLIENQHAVLASRGCQGYLQFMAGQLYQAEAIYQETIQIGTREEGRLFVVVSMVYVFYAQLLYEWNDLDTAERYINEGIEMGQRWGYIGMLAHGHWMQALLHYARGDKNKARQIMQQLTTQVSNYTIPTVQSLVEAYYAWFCLHTGENEIAYQWAQSQLQECEKMPITYHNELSLLVLIEVLIWQSHFEQATQLLIRIEQEAKSKGQQFIEIHCGALFTLLYAYQGKREQALARLVQTLMQAEAENYIHAIIDKGEPVIVLLRAIASHGIPRSLGTISPDYLQRLLHAYDTSSSNSKGTSSSESILSQREIEVLQKIAKGQSNQEIAQTFVIALSTVKTHINTIFLKLGVHSRTQAIARAKELGILLD